MADPILKIGVDIGGTFTDIVGLTASGQVFEAKVPSDKARPDAALRAGLEELASQSGSASASRLLATTDMVVQGTTVALNAVLQQDGAQTALLCTEGFRDTLEIRLGWKDERYRFDYEPPAPLVPRHLRVPIRERVDRHGRARVPLNEADVLEAADRLANEGIEAIAVCFLWSFSNPAHEERAVELLSDRLGEVFITRSSEVLPRIREYDRVSTTVLNAFVGPMVAGYVDHTEGLLRELGFSGRVRYVQSNGGLAERSEVLKRPISLLMSGPAAAPAAGRQFARLLGEDFITIDMGGTSFDTCLVRRSLPEMRSGGEIAGYRVAVPAIDVQTIGAGGGSIATLDEGLLQVGPESAEAFPGPACYRRGGDRPTLTDANVVCGLLDPQGLLGGRFDIDATLAEQAIEECIARPAGRSIEDLAVGVTQLSLRSMADAISEITLQRGFDPRNCTVLVGGGAGGLQAAELAQDLGIGRVVVPRVASELCAFGAVVADLRHDYTRSYVGAFDGMDMGEVAGLLDEMALEGRKALDSEGARAEDMTFVRAMELRYKDQVWEVAVGVSDLDLVGNPAEVERRFHARHEELYAFSEPGHPCELISLTLTAIGRSQLTVTAPAHGFEEASTPTVDRTRMVLSADGAARETPVYVPDGIPPERWIVGPAIIEERNTTIVIPFAWRAKLVMPEAAYVLEPSTNGSSR